jgi:hypothetical protein
MTGIRLPIAIICALAWAAHGAFAHPMNIQTGTITWEDDGLILHISKVDHALKQMRQQANSVAHSHPMSELYQDMLVLRDESGRRIAADSSGVAGADVVDLIFRIEASRVSIALDGGYVQAGGPRQLQLWVDAGGSGDGRLVQLTSGGNVEVIERDQQVDSTSAFDREWYTTPALEFDVSEGRATCQIEVPVLLLRAWRPFADTLGDAVDDAWLMNSSAAMAEWATSSVEVVVDEPLVPAAVEVVLLDPDDAQLGVDDNLRLNAAMARVSVSLEYLVPGTEIRSVRWTGFRPGLQRVECIVRADGDVIRRRALNATQDTISFETD